MSLSWKSEMLPGEILPLVDKYFLSLFPSSGKKKEDELDMY